MVTSKVKTMPVIYTSLSAALAAQRNRSAGPEKLTAHAGHL